MLIEVITLVAILAVTLYVYLTWNYGYWRNQGVVQVDPVVPGVGNILEALLQKKSAFTMHNDVYRKFRGHPVVGFYHLRQPALIVRNPDVIQTVLVNTFSKFHDNVFKINEKQEPYTVIDPFFSYGSKWKENRMAMAPAFTNARIKNLFPRMQEICKNLNQYLDKNLDEDFDAASVARSYMSDVVTSCGFGLESNIDKGEENIFLKYQQIFMEEAISNGLVLFALFFTPRLANILRIRFITPKISGLVKEMVNTIIDYRNKNNVTQNDFLQTILNTRDKELEAKPNDRDAQEESNIKMYGSALTLFLEGFETPSMAARYAMYELAMNVDCQKKLRDELQEEIKEGKSLEYDTLMKLPYLDQVVSETIRKYPAPLSMIKLCTESTTLQIEGRSVHIKEGTHVVIPLHALQTDPKWFPNPEKFDPDRFSERNVQDRHRYSYLPFGEGPRICIGMRLALAQVKTCLANIVLNYNILKSDKTPEKVTFNPKSFLVETNETLLIRLQKPKRHMG